MSEASDIKSYRVATGLSQAALAEKLGVDQSTVSRAERGLERLPRAASMLFQMLCLSRATQPETAA